ncbi:hypothetical protein Q5P01_010503 [Channa striata]|uniref:Tudor domain-containing protein n=1 Tax=Channa striata TaxID=64152 RepID=A0AA88MY48_CHASR|nr:hypothetical protein Q5P01_010503 [Channa striata]
MPLRFRSVVPYTLPGVLALIGWWWYISRKKERVISHDSQDGEPTLIGLQTSPAEGSNGLGEKGSVSPTNDREMPTYRHLKVINQKTEDENITHIHVQDKGAAPSLQQSSGKATPKLGMVRQKEIHNPSGQSIGKEDSLQLSLIDYKDSENTPPLLLVTQLEEHLAKETASAARFTIKKDILPFKTTKFTCLSATTADLSKAERPDPEGEVSKQHNNSNTKNEMVVSTVTPAKVASMVPFERDYLEQPPSTQDSHEHILTSSPTALAQTSTALSRVQDSITTSLLPENIKVNTNSREDQDLEHLAAGLITEVISAATQAVLGVTSSQIRDGNNLSFGSSTALAGNRLCSQQEPMAGPQKHPNVLKGAVCEMSLNGLGLNNGAHGTCEETDHSGGSDVNSMDSVDSSCTMGSREGKNNHAASSNSELIIWEIEVPKHLVGRLIGKQGRYVSYLKQSCGAKIYISTLPYTQEFQICHIEGTQQQVDKALSLVGKKFKDLDLTNLYTPPPPQLTLPSLPMTSWLLLPSGVTVEVIVVNIVSAGHIFVQQHTHPTYHVLRSLDQQMFLCYSQPGTPALPSPAEVGVICAAPAAEGAWWRAQVITFYKDTNEVEIRYVDYGGYDRVKIDTLRQIRSDFVTLPFQGAEVLLDNIAPLPGEDCFSVEATSALEEMTRGVALLAQVSNYDNNTGLPLVHLWNMVGDEVISVNRTLAERGLGSWVDGF